MRNRVTLIGCPKLDEGDYREKLTAIIRENNIQSLTVARMEVPCCGGLEFAAKEALKASGKWISLPGGGDFYGWKKSYILVEGRSF